MARAYICHARNDLGGHLLQVLDLKPNSSQPGNVLTSVSTLDSGIQSGQTGYLTYGPQNDTVVLHATGAGAFATSGVQYGLATYLMDNVNNVTGNISLNANQANGIATRMLTRVANGLPLTLADCNVAIRAEGADGGVAVGAGSTLGGAGGTRSTGSVVEVLRILSGEAYLVPANAAVVSAAGVFPWPGGVGPHVKTGAFLLRGAATYRAVRRFTNTGALARSVLIGALSKLVSTSYAWINPTFTYGAAGTALKNGGAQIGATGVAKAVTVYAVDGTVI